jgi:hypothetical protein
MMRYRSAPATGPTLAAASLILSTLISGAAFAADPAPPNNASIKRWARGTFAYQTLEDKRPRGSERFELMVHPDGSRTLLMWHDLAARNAQFSGVLRTEASFRPVEAYLSYWVESGYKGSSLIRVNGESLTITSRQPAGEDQQQTVEMPARFSIGTHPVAGDGWHLWQETAGTEGPQEASIYIMEASADLSRPLMGQLITMPFENLGAETITTPAGTFDTTHYRLATVNDVWITGPDRIMVRMVNTARDLEYLLVDFERGAGR